MLRAGVIDAHQVFAVFLKTGLCSCMQDQRNASAQQVEDLFIQSQVRFRKISADRDRLAPDRARQFPVMVPGAFQTAPGGFFASCTDQYIQFYSRDLNQAGGKPGSEKTGSSGQKNGFGHGHSSSLNEF